MGAFTRMKAWLNSWMHARITSYPQFAEYFAAEILKVVPGLTIGPAYQPDPIGAPGVYQPALGTIGEKEGEIYLSTNLVPAASWIWQNNSWNPLGGSAGGGAVQITLYDKYDEDADDAGLYREVVGQPFPTSVIWYTSPTKVTKVKEQLITRNGNQQPTQIVWKFYTNGNLTRSYTDTITYTGAFETSRSRSIV